MDAGVKVGEGVGVRVGRGVGVRVGRDVGVAVGVYVAVAVDVGVRVGLGVRLGDGVGDASMTTMVEGYQAKAARATRAVRSRVRATIKVICPDVAELEITGRFPIVGAIIAQIRAVRKRHRLEVK